jgi:hypothetical protein
MTNLIFIDSEFEEDGETIMPISLALVKPDKRHLYIEFDFDVPRAQRNAFVRDNVLPHLRNDVRLTRAQARDEVLGFVGWSGHRNDTEFWGYYADYDWVLMAQLFGRMVDLPPNYPMFCMDLQQWWVQLGRPEGVKPGKPKKAHDALEDALWNLRFYNALKARAPRPRERPRPRRPR